MSVLIARAPDDLRDPSAAELAADPLAETELILCWAAVREGLAAAGAPEALLEGVSRCLADSAHGSPARRYGAPIP
jgi:hypothetical protein